MVDNFDGFHSFLLDMEVMDFLSVFERMDDGVVIADKDGTILFYNRAQGKIDDIAPDQAMGSTVTEIYELNNRTSMMMQCLLHQTPFKNQVFFYRTISGKVANTITSVYPLLHKGQINGVICFAKDYELLRHSVPIALANEIRSDRGNGTQYTFNDLIGSSPDFIRVRDTAQKASASPSPIMIQGETGTGKELFAQAIHNHGPRYHEKYVAVNCAAIPHDLLEGMLFGTARGAFTGALDKPGLFETAHRGTLFLDELLAMPIELQAKLLRALQEKRVRRVGSIRETPVDVKIISSVSMDPRIAIRENRLRTDLFYRLGVVMLKLPPLRRRLDSLQELSEHFIRKINKRLGTQVTQFSAEVYDLFRTYDWPGNIRELEHLIEGAMNMAGHETVLGLEQFTPGLDSIGQKELRTWHSPLPHVPDLGADPVAAPPVPPVQGLAGIQAEQERNAIDSALTESRGNVSQAARMLGISRQLLHYKIKKYGFHRQDFVQPASRR
ncbi:MAG: sigma 54-interacting transcriptional regulator [Desulfobacterales bacterium]|nr:sigma 54-interacting transcriptional regulator [Desulfobacterales bacterium]